MLISTGAKQARVRKSENGSNEHANANANANANAGVEIDAALEGPQVAP